MQKRRLEIELKVGIFVAIGMGLLMSAVLLLGGAKRLMTQHVEYKAYFSDVSGLIPGAKVVLNGIRVGQVEMVELDQNTKKIRIDMQVPINYSGWIRSSTRAEISTQGVLGDKYVALTLGADDEPVLEPGSIIPNKPSKSMQDFLTDGEKLVNSLNSIAVNLDLVVKSFVKENRNEAFFEGMAKTARNLSRATTKFDKELGVAKFGQTVQKLNSILEKIDGGTGTMGALINDPALYEDAKSLVGGVNRNRIMRNLIRKTIKDSEDERAVREKKDLPPDDQRNPAATSR